MLTKEQNERLMQVGPGTPMGELFLLGRRLQNVTPRVTASTYRWNAHLWDVRATS